MLASGGMLYLPVSVMRLWVAALSLSLLPPGAQQGIDRAALRSACVDHALPDACLQLTDALEKGALRELFPSERALYVEVACELGSSLGCARAQKFSELYPDYEEYEGDVQCMLRDDSSSCWQVAEEAHEMAAKSPLMADVARSRIRRAAALGAAGCARKKPDDCQSAAHAYSSGAGMKADPRKAFEFDRRACTLGKVIACGQVGDRTQGDEAIRYYRMSCEATPPDGEVCLKLARATEKADKAPKEIEMRFRQACEATAFDACGWLLPRLRDLAHESPKILHSLKMWCDRGGTLACERLKGLPPAG